MQAAAGLRATPEVAALGLSWPLLIGVGAFALLMGQARLLGDPDIYWHLRTGQWIVEHLAIPQADHFSHTLHGAPWTAHEWLAEVLFALAFAAGGWTAVVLVTAGAMASALAILARYLLRHLIPPVALLFVALAASLHAPHLLARPHVLVAPLLVIWAIGLVNAREEGRAPSLWLALLMVLWANLHGSFVFGLALIVPFAVDAVLGSKGKERRSAARAWGLFLAAALAASIATPHGPGGLGFALDVNGMAFALSHIREWRSPDFQQLQPLEIALLLAAAALFARGLRLSWLRIVLLLGLLHLALKHARHVDLLALIGPVLLARPMAEQWYGRRREAPGDPSRLDRLAYALVPPASAPTTAVMLLVLAGLGVQAVRADALRPAAAITPEAAVAALAQAGTQGAGLNEYAFGGYLIFRGVPTFVDGRADLYGDAFLASYVSAVQLTDPEGLLRLIEKHRVDWTMLRPGTPALALLDRLPGWRRLHADPLAVVHVRE